MKFRWVLAAGLAAAAVATSVLAQSEPIATRMALMKGNNDNARNVSQMIRGQQPFDPAKVDAAFAQWAETAQKLPPNSAAASTLREWFRQDFESGWEQLQRENSRRQEALPLGPDEGELPLDEAKDI